MPLSLSVEMHALLMLLAWVLVLLSERLVGDSGAVYCIV
nr:hypothetical protein Q903MT_gene3069 [Picea sitchensis]